MRVVVSGRKHMDREKGGRGRRAWEHERARQGKVIHYLKCVFE